MTNTEARAHLEKVADSLSEHFDSVHIFATLPGEGSSQTAGMDAGRGNFYAQTGQIWEWLSMQEQYNRCEAIRRDTKDQGNDG